METKPYSKRREMIDFPDVLAGLTDDILVCAPVGVIKVARKFLRTRGLWRITYVKTYIDDAKYEIPSVGEFEPVEEAISQFLEDTNEMNCDDLATELANIVAEITAVTAELSGLRTDTLAGASGISSAIDTQTVSVNDIEEQLNEIITQLGGTPVVLT